MASVLIYRIGSLGDTLVALPAMWTVRRHFADARITLLCDHHPRKNHVLATDLLNGSGVVDDFLTYPVINSRLGRLTRPLRMARLLATLRKRKFDTLVYLAPTESLLDRLQRDRQFFQAAGIRQLIGFEPTGHEVRSTEKRPSHTLPRESELLLRRLELSGIPMSAAGELRSDLGIGEPEKTLVRDWLAGLPSDGGRPWIALGPGSKMPVKIWPAERYDQVVRSLIEQFDIWPVVFGGSEDRQIGEQLIRGWGRGYLAAGAIGLRASAAAIGRCILYLGNDTGTMHMAASEGVQCVAIFSSRSSPGLWYPYGENHRIFRTTIECQGCMLEVCIDRKMQCILSINTSEVDSACRGILNRVLTTPMIQR